MPLPIAATTDVEGELSALIDYIQTGLLSPALRRRVGHFAERDLKMALRDLMDWMSLRAIVRGRSSGVSGRVCPLAGRVLARLVLGEILCVPDGRVAFRVEVPAERREGLEDWVKERIWQRGKEGRRNQRGRIKYV